MVLLSLLTRMRLTAMGLPTASVPFTHQRVQMELLVGEEARVARRHVAAHTRPQTLSTLRAKAPTSSKDWELLQASLFAGGLCVCGRAPAPAAAVPAAKTGDLRVVRLPSAPPKPLPPELHR